MIVSNFPSSQIFIVVNDFFINIDNFALEKVRHASNPVILGNSGLGFPGTELPGGSGIPGSKRQDSVIHSF